MLSEGNGALTIQATRQSILCNNNQTYGYAGGFISTTHWGQPSHFQFTYGYMEARIKMPNSSGGAGYWPGFWSAAADGSWPPEIDAVEWNSRNPTSASVHYHYRCSTGSCAAGEDFNTGTDLSNGFHTYGVDWESTFITWYVDGSPVYTYQGATPSVPMDVRLNLAVNGTYWNPVSAVTAFPASMEVDFVHVWEH